MLINKSLQAQLTNYNDVFQALQEPIKTLSEEFILPKDAPFDKLKHNKYSAFWDRVSSPEFFFSTFSLAAAQLCNKLSSSDTDNRCANSRDWMTPKDLSRFKLIALEEVTIWQEYGLVDRASLAAFKNTLDDLRCPTLLAQEMARHLPSLETVFAQIQKSHIGTELPPPVYPSAAALGAIHIGVLTGLFINPVGVMPNVELWFDGSPTTEKANYGKIVGSNHIHSDVYLMHDLAHVLISSEVPSIATVGSRILTSEGSLISDLIYNSNCFQKFLVQLSEEEPITRAIIGDLVSLLCREKSICSFFLQPTSEGIKRTCAEEIEKMVHESSYSLSLYYPEVFQIPSGIKTNFELTEKLTLGEDKLRELLLNSIA